MYTEYSVPLIAFGGLAVASGAIMTIVGVVWGLAHCSIIWGCDAAGPGPAVPLFFSGLGVMGLGGLGIAVGVQPVPVKPSVAITPHGASAGVQIAF